MSWLIIFTFIACKNNKEEKKSDPVRTSAASYLTNDDILNLSNSADYVDMLFYHMNISVSQNDPPSIRQSVNFLTASGKPSNMQCPPIGRISFLSKGKIIREADIHLSPGCNYFTIIENKVSSGTVLMSPEGVKFLQALIDSYKPQ
ncbi:MAG: hypothetical protein KA109_03970 [Saprospiraceae bacterium]|jgi:hypothetical protein|nr:hypothetical protein [Saprospiraceae bacterium]MBK6480447.1 hypothetical protein [Saprospiraceae bacterium]MBK7371732.1 hypothetical protein [Saprospiraceae bacterium]MBK7435791.1 hypothetical protein [Saprospiraceae bacterium]MBK7606444.1 hypothetical protein [Saprospiraceae bacterium]